jgi:hypothetical protein
MSSSVMDSVFKVSTPLGLFCRLRARSQEEAARAVTKRVLKEVEMLTKLECTLAAKGFLYKMNFMKAKKSKPTKTAKPATKKMGVKKKPAKKGSKVELPKGWSELMY